MRNTDEIRDVITREVESDDCAVRTIGIAIPSARAVNSIQISIEARMAEEMAMLDAPIPIVEERDNGEHEHECFERVRDGVLKLKSEIKMFFGREVGAAEIAALRCGLEEFIYQKFASHIEIARSLGPSNRYGPTEQQYKAACKAVELVPIEGLLK